MRVIVTVPDITTEAELKILMNSAAASVFEANKQGRRESRQTRSVRLGMLNRKVVTQAKKVKTGYSVFANWKQDINAN